MQVLLTPPDAGAEETRQVYNCGKFTLCSHRVNDLVDIWYEDGDGIHLSPEFMDSLDELHEFFSPVSEKVDKHVQRFNYHEYRLWCSRFSRATNLSRNVRQVSVRPCGKRGCVCWPHRVQMCRRNGIPDDADDSMLPWLWASCD